MSVDLSSLPQAVTTLAPGDRIDVICDAFENAWLAGRRPDLRDYLQFAQAGERAALFSELLLVDIEYRRHHGQIPTQEDYLDSFGEFAEQIQAVAFKRGFDASSSITIASPNGAAAAKTAERPRWIEHFRLLELLGSGAAGEVWKARDTRLQRDVAIKVPRSAVMTPDGLHRFLREGRAAAQLSHRSIVQVYDVGQTGGSAYIVSDYIRGPNLRKWLAERQPSHSRSAELCATLAEALHYAHEQGVIHRDLKPANVIIDEQEQPHIADFGLAKWAEDASEMTLEGQPLGTPAYMSPEQARGQASQADRRTDVYSLGVMLYEMLTGEVPFSGDQSAVMQAVADQEPRRPRTINRSTPRNLETICLKAMEKEPRCRYQTARDMAADLERYLRGEPIVARPAGPVERTWRYARRRPAVAALVTLACVLLGSLAIGARLAQENRQLLGLRRVTIDTKPPGAKVAFVPLHPTTWEPRPEEIVHARRRSPVTEHLRPGKYLIVAVLDDGRFHEVYRTVPGEGENMRFIYRQSRWAVTSDGSVVLPRIKIPEQNIASNMARIDGGEVCMIFASEPRDGAKSRVPKRRVPTFYLDTVEFSLADYTRSKASQRPPWDRRWQPRAQECAVTVNHGEAMDLAEWAGKRLPTAAEFDLALAAHTGKCLCTLHAGTVDDPSEFGPVGTPAWDKLPTDPPVYGLCSNVAEWTMTVAGTYLRTVVWQEKDPWADYRVVKGGDATVMDGNPTVAPEHRHPDSPAIMGQAGVMPGLGFRCVRSAKPRLEPADFEHELEPEVRSSE